MANSIPLDIIDFIRRPDILNDHSFSETQTTIVKSLYALPLTESQLAIYLRCTGLDHYQAKEQVEATIIAGRRSGKTGKLAAAIACYETFRNHGLPSGEEAYVLLLASTLDQARIAFRYIRTYLRNSPILSKRIRNETKDEIKLDNNVTIGCYASCFGGLRGRTVVAAICDEIAFWYHDPAAANPAEEVLDAIRPAMLTVQNTKLIKISTPFGKQGILWDEFQRRRELDFPVWQVSTFDMNPTVSRDRLEGERHRNEEKYKREYLAEFTDSVNAWITPEILNPCIVRGRGDLPRQRGVSYIAAIDAALRHDDFVLIILHQVNDGTIIVDGLASWTGTKTNPLPFEPILHQIARILEEYQINTLIGDQHCADVLKQTFLKLGIVYEICNFSAFTRPKIFSSLKHVLVQGRIQLPDDADLLRQLRNLREEKTSDGRIDVQPTGAMKDDKAVALALAVNEICKRAETLPPPQRGLIDIQRRPAAADYRFVPASCPFAAVCQNHPRCLDKDQCFGYKA